MSFVEGRFSFDGTYFLASCGDHPPFACCVFGLGRNERNYAATPTDQFLKNDYQPVVVEQATQRALDAATGVRKESLALAPSSPKAWCSRTRSSRCGLPCRHRALRWRADASPQPSPRPALHWPRRGHRVSPGNAASSYALVATRTV